MQPEDFTIRRATTDDIERLVALRAHLLDGTQAHYSSQTPQDSNRWQSAYRYWLAFQLIVDDGIQVLTAVESSTGKIVGCVTGIIDRRAPAPGAFNGRTGWIQSLVVEPVCRQQGIARLLVTELLQWFAAHNVHSTCLQSTTDADRLYASLGFIATGQCLQLRQEVPA